MRMTRARIVRPAPPPLFTARWSKWRTRGQILGAIGSVVLPGMAAAQTVVLPEIQVITTSPLPGAGIDRDRVPAMVQTLSADDFQRTASPSVTDTLLQRIPGVSTSDVQG